MSLSGPNLEVSKPDFVIKSIARGVRTHSLKERSSDSASRWSIILAGGEGVRMRSFILETLGETRPKQYCAFTGSRSMLQHTIDRAAKVVPKNNVVTVIDASHSQYLIDNTRAGSTGKIIRQPMGRGTASGILVAAAYIYSIDPGATLLILPSDHFAYPEGSFIEYLNAVCDSAEKSLDKLILLSALPERAETEYGWIEIDSNPRGGSRADHKQPRPVLQFYEKPDQASAERLMENGCLWNTMVTAVKARTLWSIGWSLLPEIMKQLESLRIVFNAVARGLLEPDRESLALAKTYAMLDIADFSRDVLQKVAPFIETLCLQGVHWSDWGEPGRVLESLSRLAPRSQLTSELVTDSDSPFTSTADPGSERAEELAAVQPQV